MARMALDRFAPALAALLLWALAAGSALYWALHAGSSAPPATAAVAAPELPPLQAQAVARGLGAVAAAPQQPQAAAPSRYTLAGVVTHGSERGAALIAEQGQPPKPYRVGAALPGGWTLQAVSRRSATLAAADGRQQHLHMPEPEAPARRVSGSADSR